VSIKTEANVDAEVINITNSATVVPESVSSGLRWIHFIKINFVWNINNETYIAHGDRVPQYIGRCLPLCHVIFYTSYYSCKVRRTLFVQNC